MTELICGSFDDLRNALLVLESAELDLQEFVRLRGGCGVSSTAEAGPSRFDLLQLPFFPPVIEYYFMDRIRDEVKGLQKRAMKSEKTVREILKKKRRGKTASQQIEKANA